MQRLLIALLVGFFSLTGAVPVLAAEVVKVGLNYPRTGPYYVQGLDQLRAAEMARDEINATGGIMGKKVEVYAVKIKPAAQIMKDNYKLDYFEIIDSMSGNEAAVTLKEWQANRTAAGKPAQLEKLPGEK